MYIFPFYSFGERACGRYSDASTDNYSCRCGSHYGNPSNHSYAWYYFRFLAFVVVLCTFISEDELLEKTLVFARTIMGISEQAHILSWYLGNAHVVFGAIFYLFSYQDRNIVKRIVILLTFFLFGRSYCPPAE